MAVGVVCFFPPPFILPPFTAQWAGHPCVAKRWKLLSSHCRGNAVLRQAVFPGVGDIWPDVTVPGLQSGSAALRAPLCLQESSFGSPWLVLPLLQVDCWDAVGVSACSLNSVSHCLFIDQALRERLSILLLCMAPALGISSWGRVRYIPSLAFSPWRGLSALVSVSLSWWLFGSCLNCLNCHLLFHIVTVGWENKKWNHEIMNYIPYEVTF